MARGSLLESGLHEPESYNVGACRVGTGAVGLFRALAMVVVELVVLSGCGGTESVEGGTSCVEGDLIAQCPPGSDPKLEAMAVSMCEGSGEFSAGGSDTDATPGPGTEVLPSGHVEGVCRGSGECKVYCQFVIPCECGIETITRDELRCKDCLETAACGNRVCEGTESAESCPQDCGCVCEERAQRCNGSALQVCERCNWTELACGPNETCGADPEKGAKCVRTSL